MTKITKSTEDSDIFAEPKRLDSKPNTQFNELKVLEQKQPTKKSLPKKRKRNNKTTPLLPPLPPHKKRRVSFTTVDLYAFEQRCGPEAHGVPDEGGAPLYLGKLVKQSPKIQIDKYIEITQAEEFLGAMSPEKRVEIASNKMSKKAIKKSEELCDKIRESRVDIGCQCLPPECLSVSELKSVLRQNKQSGWSKCRKPDLVRRVEKIKGKSCCLPNSGCPCVDGGIECYSETCLCLSETKSKRFCRNTFGKKMFQYPRKFTSRKTQSILKTWEKFYTPPPSKKPKFFKIPKKSFT